VICTEGSTATSGERLLRPDLAYEAIRLARILAALLPDEPEVHGLLALCELTAARFPARAAPDGTPVLLEDQDRRLWDVSAIRRGLAALGRASARGLGPYGLQAAIAATHAAASSVATTDRDRIVVLYEALGRVAPSPVVELNRAVAVAMATGPEQGPRHRRRTGLKFLSSLMQPYGLPAGPSLDERATTGRARECRGVRTAGVRGLLPAISHPGHRPGR
jgi:predicted RNA polymerase sigma factor